MPASRSAREDSCARTFQPRHPGPPEPPRTASDRAESRRFSARSTIWPSSPTATSSYVVTRRSRPSSPSASQNSLQAAGSCTGPGAPTGNTRGEGAAASALLFRATRGIPRSGRKAGTPRWVTFRAAASRSRPSTSLTTGQDLARRSPSGALGRSRRRGPRVVRLGASLRRDGIHRPEPVREEPGVRAAADSGPVLLHGAPLAFRTEDITRTHRPSTCTIRLFRNAELFLRPEVLNLFDEKGVVAVNSTVLTALNAGGLQKFNPFTEKPVRGVHYDLDPTFGKPTNSADYQLPRTFRISAGIRF